MDHWKILFFIFDVRRAFASMWGLFSPPKSNKGDEFIDILCLETCEYDWNGQNEPPRGSQRLILSCLEAQNDDKFFTFARFWSSWRGLGHWGILGDLYFQKWAPRLDGSTIFETCTSKNGKRVTEGAYAFAWDEEIAGERAREDETRSQITK